MSSAKVSTDIYAYPTKPYWDLRINSPGCPSESEASVSELLLNLK